MNNPKLRLLLVFTIMTGLWQSVLATTFDIVSAVHKVAIVYAADGPRLDSIIAAQLANDIELVSGYRPMVTNDITAVNGNVILIGTYQTQLIQSLQDAYFKKLNGKWECFGYKIISNPFKNISQALVITGSDPRGTAYGVFDFSKKLGVSPWYWWADVQPEKKRILVLDINPFISQSPSVKYRGIFINDED
jgi:hypothetical protein